MKDIAIYCAGGFGREVACLIRIINQKNPIWKMIGFFDDTQLKGSSNSYGTILGGLDELNSWKDQISIVIANGNPNAVYSIYSKITNPLVDFPNIIHPDFKIIDPDSFKIGIGNIIQDGCIASCNVCLGDFNVLNGANVFGHDDIVGNFNSFMPAIRISGGVVIGDCNFFGVGSIILQQIKIGNNIRLGAGSVLMTKPKDGFLYMGNPAKKVKF